MAIIFTCSWLPYFTIKLLLGMGIQVLLNVMEAVVIIRYITSFAKPLLYTFFKRDFLSSLRNLLQNRENVSLSAQKNSNTLLNSLVDYGQDQVSTTASWHHLKAKDKDQELIAKKTWPLLKKHFIHALFNWLHAFFKNGYCPFRWPLTRIKKHNLRCNV